MFLLPSRLPLAELRSPWTLLFLLLWLLLLLLLLLLVLLQLPRQWIWRHCRLLSQLWL